MWNAFLWLENPTPLPPPLSFTLCHSQARTDRAFLVHFCKLQMIQLNQDGGNKGYCKRSKPSRAYTVRTSPGMWHKQTYVHVILCCCLFIVCLSQLLVKALFINSTLHWYKDPHIPYMNLVWYNWRVQVVGASWKWISHRKWNKHITIIMYIYLVARVVYIYVNKQCTLHLLAITSQGMRQRSFTLHQSFICSH